MKPKLILASSLLALVALGLPILTQTPWPTCLRFPVRCDPTADPFTTTTTWHSKSDHD